MTPAEARLKVFESITDFFITMGDDGEPLSDAERLDVEQSLAELTEMLLDMLSFQVSSVVSDDEQVTINATISITK